MRRHGVTAAAAAVVVAAGVAYAARSGPDGSSTPTASIATGTAQVTRGTLTNRLQLGGVLGYSGSYTVDHPGVPGVLTAAPRPGTTIGRGGVLYRVADTPVRLLLGAVPVYRDLRLGMTDGPDVRQLERNLVAMGFDPYRRMTVDRRFSAATAAAIRRWEASWGRKRYQRTGRLGQGQIVFLPTAMRVTQVPARIGAAVGSGTTVLTGTSTNRAVIAELDTGERAGVRVGAPVAVALPDADPLPGRVVEIGQVATAPADEESDGPQPSVDPDAATVPLVIGFRPPRGFTLDQAPVNIDITTGVRRDVLLIPIAALLARPGGGYQVRLADGSRVPVEPASFDESTGQVEIAGGVSEGQSVEVPVS
jgi:hypothetical protein